MNTPSHPVHLPEDGRNFTKLGCSVVRTSPPCNARRVPVCWLFAEPRAHPPEAAAEMWQWGHGDPIPLKTILAGQGDSTGIGGLASSARVLAFITPPALTAIHNPAGASPNAPSHPHADDPITHRPVGRNDTGCKTALHSLSLSLPHRTPCIPSCPTFSGHHSRRHFTNDA